MRVPGPWAEGVGRSFRNVTQGQQSLLVPSGPWHLCSSILNHLSYQEGHQNVLNYYRRVTRAFCSSRANRLAATVVTSHPAHAATSPYYSQCKLGSVASRAEKLLGRYDKRLKSLNALSEYLEPRLPNASKQVFGHVWLYHGPV